MADRCVTMADRCVTMADRCVTMADRCVTMADRRVFPQLIRHCQERQELFWHNCASVTAESLVST